MWKCTLLMFEHSIWQFPTRPSGQTTRFQRGNHMENSWDVDTTWFPRVSHVKKVYMSHKIPTWSPRGKATCYPCDSHKFCPLGVCFLYKQKCWGKSISNTPSPMTNRIFSKMMSIIITYLLKDHSMISFMTMSIFIFLQFLSKEQFHVKNEGIF